MNPLTPLSTTLTPCRHHARRYWTFIGTSFLVPFSGPHRGAYSFPPPMGFGPETRFAFT